MPSADGIKGKLTEALGGEAEKAGASSGKTLAQSLIGSLKGVLVAAGVGKTLQSIFSVGSEFEQSLAKVGTIADTSAVPLASLQQQILQTSSAMGVGAADIAEAAYQAISAGQDTGNAVSFAAQAAQLAQGGFTSSAAAVDILTTALNAYGLESEQAGHISDVLLTTQNLGKTSVDALAGSMGRVIPLAAAYGVNMENVSSALAVMTANGIATAEATTYTKSMLNELGDSGSNVSKILQEQTGQSFAQLNADGKSLGDVLGILYDSVDGDGTAFAGLWSSVEAGTGALSLANAGTDKFNQVLGEMCESSGAAEKAADTMTSTMQHSLQSIAVNAQNMGIKLMDSVSGPLGDALGLADGYLQTLSERFQNGGFAGLVEGLDSVFTDLAANVAPKLLQSGIEMLQTLGEGMVTGIPTMLADVMPRLMDRSGHIREGAGQLVDAGLAMVENLAQGIANSLPTLIETVPTIVTNIAGIINDNAPKLLLTAGKIILTLAKGLLDALPTLAANIPQIVQAIVSVISAFNWMNLGKKIITLFKNGIMAMKEAVLNGMKQLMEHPINYIKSLPEKFTQWGKDMIAGLVKGITDSIDSVKKAVSNVVEAITSKLHFSRPDEGPLRDYEQWMPDFLHGLAAGIDANIWQVENAANRLAAATARPWQAEVQTVLGSNQRLAFASPVPAAGVTYQVHNEFHTHDSLSESELTREAEDMARRLKWAIP